MRGKQEGGEDTEGSYKDKVDKEQEALEEGENIDAELYLVPVKEYSGNGSGKLPGNVRNVRGDDRTTRATLSTTSPAFT